MRRPSLAPARFCNYTSAAPYEHTVERLAQFTVNPVPLALVVGQLFRLRHAGEIGCGFYGFGILGLGRRAMRCGRAGVAVALAVVRGVGRGGFLVVAAAFLRRVGLAPLGPPYRL